jgi:hypothetical protein
VDGTSQQPSPPAEARSRRTPWIIGVAAVVVLVAAGCGIVNGHQTSNTVPTSHASPVVLPFTGLDAPSQITLLTAVVKHV